MTQAPGSAIAPEERPNDPQQFYEVGATAVFASAADQRFSFSLYVPRSAHGRRAEVAVLVHDTMRAVESYRAAFTEWSERTGVVLVLPMFPAGIGAPFDLHGYKYLDANGVRYDTVLLAMLDEAAEHFGLDVRRVLLFGFSGGGQFVHRFAILHPERVRAVSVGAPGGVTLPGDARTWWVGTADVAERFGRAVDPSALQGLRLQALVGDADLDTWEVSDPRLRSSPYWMPGADDAGVDRVARMSALADAFERVGAIVTRTTVPGAGHDPSAMFAPAMAFFDDVLAEDAGVRA